MKRGCGSNPNDYHSNITDNAEKHCRNGDAPHFPPPAPVGPILPPHILQNPHAAGDALLNAVRMRNGPQVMFLFQHAFNRIPWGYMGWALTESVKTGDIGMTSYLTTHVAHMVHPQQVELAKSTAHQLGRPDIEFEIDRIQKLNRIK